MELRPHTKYCGKCLATTNWHCDDGVSYTCVGDSEKHPERKLYGCGAKIAIALFGARVFKDKK